MLLRPVREGDEWKLTAYFAALSKDTKKRYTSLRLVLVTGSGDEAERRGRRAEHAPALGKGK